MKKAIFTCMVMACLLPIGGWAQTETTPETEVTGALDFTLDTTPAEGDGYKWENGTLTLEGLNLSLEDVNGIVLPDGAKIILKERNTIHFESNQTEDIVELSAAIVSTGALNFEGDGSLNIHSSHEAIHAMGNLSINGGAFEIETMGESVNGSVSATSASINNSSITINAATDEGIMLQNLSESNNLKVNNLEIKNSLIEIQATEEEGMVIDGNTNINNSLISLYSGAKDAMEVYEMTISNSQVALNAPNYDSALYGNITSIENSVYIALGKGTESILRNSESGTVISGSWVESSSPITIESVTNSFVRTISTATSTVYGNYTLPSKVTIAENETLIIPEGATLTVPSDFSLTNNGEIQNKGVIYIESGATLDGTESVGGTVIDNNPSRPEITYYSLTIIPSEGATLTSRHDKKTVKEGGSFTLSLTIDESYAGAEPTVYVKRGRGEWTALEIDTVSGYYQIRDVRNDITVKVSGDGIYPVGNETVAPQQARIYASGSKIVVVTPQPTEVQIISMSGAVVAACQVNGQQEFGNLANGIYIVRAGNETIKLHVAQ